MSRIVGPRQRDGALRRLHRRLAHQRTPNAGLSARLVVGDDRHVRHARRAVGAQHPSGHGSGLDRRRSEVDREQRDRARHGGAADRDQLAEIRLRVGRDIDGFHENTADRQTAENEMARCVGGGLIPAAVGEARHRHHGVAERRAVLGQRRPFERAAAEEHHLHVEMLAVPLNRECEVPPLSGARVNRDQTRRVEHLTRHVVEGESPLIVGRDRADANGHRVFAAAGTDEEQPHVGIGNRGAVGVDDAAHDRRGLVADRRRDRPGPRSDLLTAAVHCAPHGDLPCEEGSNGAAQRQERDAAAGLQGHAHDPVVLHRVV